MVDGQGERVGVLLGTHRTQAEAERQSERWRLEMAVQNSKLLARFEARGIEIVAGAESIDDVCQEIRSRKFRQSMSNERYQEFKEGFGI